MSLTDDELQRIRQAGERFLESTDPADGREQRQAERRRTLDRRRTPRPTPDRRQRKRRSTD